MSSKTYESENQNNRIFELFDELKQLLANREMEDFSRFDPANNKRISVDVLEQIYEQKQHEVNQFQETWDSLDELDKLVTQNLQYTMHESNTINQFLHHKQKQEKNSVKRNKKGLNGIWRADA